MWLLAGVWTPMDASLLLATTPEKPYRLPEEDWVFFEELICAHHGLRAVVASEASFVCMVYLLVKVVGRQEEVLCTR